jgi:hypothetical protein
VGGGRVAEVNPGLVDIPVVRVIGDIPVIFTDGVSSHSHAPGIAKYYLYRVDSDPFAIGNDKNVVVAQVVMQAEGFAKMVAFLNHRLSLMVKDGAVSKAAVDAAMSFDFTAHDARTTKA